MNSPHLRVTSRRRSPAHFDMPLRTRCGSLELRLHFAGHSLENLRTTSVKRFASCASIASDCWVFFCSYSGASPSRCAEFLSWSRGSSRFSAIAREPWLVGFGDQSAISRLARRSRLRATGSSKRGISASEPFLQILVIALRAVRVRCRGTCRHVGRVGDALFGSSPLGRAPAPASPATRARRVRVPSLTDGCPVLRSITRPPRRSGEPWVSTERQLRRR